MTNIMKLLSRFIAVEAIPPGTRDGLGAGLDFFLDKEKRERATHAAQTKMKAAILSIKMAADSPWRHASDEAIAAELLRQIESREKTTLT